MVGHGAPASRALRGTRLRQMRPPRRNLSLVKELGDRAAQGRAYGNLGNTHYLLGSFMEATAFHKEVSAPRGSPAALLGLRLVRGPGLPSPHMQTLGWPPWAGRLRLPSAWVPGAAL